jgi:hypothetical protein
LKFHNTLIPTFPDKELPFPDTRVLSRTEGSPSWTGRCFFPDRGESFPDKRLAFPDKR